MVGLNEQSSLQVLYLSKYVVSRQSLQISRSRALEGYSSVFSGCLQLTAFLTRHGQSRCPSSRRENQVQHLT